MKNFDESKLKQEFSASADLQAEFGGDVKAYVGFKLAEAQGRIRGLKSSVVPASPVGAGAEPAACDEAALKAEFAASIELQGEFAGDVGAYIAFKKAEAAGKTRIGSGSGVVAFSAPAPKTERSEKVTISEPVSSAAAEAASREKIQQEDEARQYASGVTCEP